MNIELNDDSQEDKLSFDGILHHFDHAKFVRERGLTSRRESLVEILKICFNENLKERNLSVLRKSLLNSCYRLFPIVKQNSTIFKNSVDLTALKDWDGILTYQEIKFNLLSLSDAEVDCFNESLMSKFSSIMDQFMVPLMTSFMVKENEGEEKIVSPVLDKLNKLDIHTESDFITFLLEIKLGLLKSNFENAFPRILKKNKWLIDDKIILLKKIINNLKEGLEKGKYVNPLEGFSVFRHIFNVSKKASDNYLCSLIDFYNDRLIDWGAEPVKYFAITQSDFQKVEPDNRIDTNLTPEEIRTYFSQLLRVHKGEQILSEASLKAFLASNFKGFSNPAPRKLLKVSLNKNQLSYFIYKFYLDKDINKCRDTQMRYCKLLVENFEAFENDNLKTLSSNLSKEPRDKFFHY